jgi:4-hydroxythreonine-4-phosphate dehydrogenase
MTKPVALTCGEPAGVGLEISLKAWASLKDEVPFFLIADRDHLAAQSGSVPVIEIAHPDEAAKVTARALPLLHHGFSRPNVPGTPDPANAPSVVSAIERGVALVRSGAALALCTNPIHKKALQDGAGFAYPGHTEFLAALGGVERSVMMLTAPGLSVVPVTIHIPLKDVPAALSRDALEQTILIVDAALRHLKGLVAPRIAVAGLNPHAGEGGKMGREELDLIAPVLEGLQARGLAVSGPHPADTMFHAEARATYDVAVCMYHDQALIPLKTLDFHGGVNVTLGLPFVRTSPDHGTALDIAGKGIANPSSLIAALRQAAQLGAQAST